MKLHLSLIGATLLAALAVAPGSLGIGSVLAADAAQVQLKDAWYHPLVDAEFVAKHAVLPKPEGVLIIDLRPTAATRSRRTE